MPLTHGPALPFLYVVAGAASLGWAMYRTRRARRLERQKAIRALLPLLPLGVFCICALPAFLGLAVFSGTCLLWAVCVPLECMLPVHGKAVLITGCDSGFGYEFAKHLDELGFRVFAGVLHKNGIGSQELSSQCSSRLSLIQLDVTSAEQIKNAYTEIQASLELTESKAGRQSLFLRRSMAALTLSEAEPKENEVPIEKGLWGIIHNAGLLGFIGDGELLPMSVYKKCMDVNFFGPVAVSKAFFPLLRTSQGRLVCISSMAGICPISGLAAYGSAKAALTMFSGVMRQELSKWGVKVATVHPGGFITSLYGSQEKWAEQDEIILHEVGEEAKEAFGEDYIRSMKNRYYDMIKSSSSDLSPVLHDVVHALLAEKPKYQYTPGKLAYIIPFIFRHLPLWLYDGLESKLFQNSKIQPHALHNHHNQTKNYQ